MVQDTGRRQEKHWMDQQGHWQHWVRTQDTGRRQTKQINVRVKGQSRMDKQRDTGNIGYKTQVHKTQDEGKQNKIRSRMDKQETLATLEKTEGAIKNGQARDTGNIGYTRHTQDEGKQDEGKQNKKDKQETLATLGTYTRHRTKANKTDKR